MKIKITRFLLMNIYKKLKYEVLPPDIGNVFAFIADETHMQIHDFN